MTRACASRSRRLSNYFSNVADFRTSRTGEVYTILYSRARVSASVELHRLPGAPCARRGERVVACVIHGDEGHVASDGIARRNVHAHVVVDRTDRRGRVVNSIPDRKGGTRRTTITDRKAQGRRVLDMTARITDLARGKDVRETKRRHIDHHSYRAPGPVTGCGPRARSRTSRCACGTGMRRSSG